MSLMSKTGCWVDVFELPLFRGRRRRLYGPTEFVSLRSRTSQWGISISSVIVGPEAHVRLFRSSEAQSAALWMQPGHAYQDLSNWGIGEDVDSLSILDDAPQPGDGGYERFTEPRLEM
jgi:hypothetical protein